MVKRKKTQPRPVKRRNPFAGRPRSGAGFHEEAGYTKKERRRLREETEKEAEADGKEKVDKEAEAGRESEGKGD